MMKELKKTKKNEISSNYNDNLQRIKDEFHHPANSDLNIRSIDIKALNKECTLFFLRGIADIKKVEDKIIKPIMEADWGKNLAECEDIGEVIITKVISGTSINKMKYTPEVISEITDGNTILFIDGFDEAISISTTTFEYRKIEKPTVENILKGPKESFTESSEVNCSLIRKHLKDKNLITEKSYIGERGFTELYLMYIDGIVNPEILEEVKNRLNKIKIDSIEEISILEQFIEDRPYSMFPSTLTTERPDRVVSFLKEGHIALLLDNSSMILIVPITIFTLFHTSEDMYQRFLYGNFVRFIRLASMITALFVPAIYMAITTFHSEMMPPDLVMATIAAREKLPFPVLMEILIMETCFELVREAGVRIPTAVGPTIGIVGTLILGQAAVEANIVSPVLVISVAITGLSSFAIPEMSLSYMIRIGRFIFLAIAAIGGFYGITLSVVALVAYIATIESFGVPFLAPYTPDLPSSGDLIFRPIIKKVLLRPSQNRPLDKKRGRDRRGV